MNAFVVIKNEDELPEPFQFWRRLKTDGSGEPDPDAPRCGHEVGGSQCILRPNHIIRHAIIDPTLDA